MDISCGQFVKWQDWSHSGMWTGEGTASWEDVKMFHQIVLVWTDSYTSESASSGLHEEAAHAELLSHTAIISCCTGGSPRKTVNHKHLTFYISWLRYPILFQRTVQCHDKGKQKGKKKKRKEKSSVLSPSCSENSHQHDSISTYDGIKLVYIYM